MKNIIVGTLSLFALSGCASIIDGTTQEVLVNTNPSEAKCSLERQSISIATIDPTPGSATIKKTKYDLTIICNKDGYEEATFINHSGTQDATWGNIVAGGGIGWAIDSASGADNKYTSPVNITLVPEEHKATKSHKKKKHKAAVQPTENEPAPVKEESQYPTPRR